MANKQVRKLLVTLLHQDLKHTNALDIKWEPIILNQSSKMIAPHRCSKKCLVMKNSHATQTSNKLKENTEPLTPAVRGSGGSVMLWGAFCCYCFGPLGLLVGTVTANLIKGTP